MCGLVAATGVPEATQWAVTAVDAISHRGPDGAGVATVDAGALAMCRLQVRPPRAVPLPLRHGDSVVGFNGEIYASASGEPVETVHDELIAILDADDPPDGMWAVVAANGSGLRCRRDRWGFRPLYYAATGRGWVVASELPPLVDRICASLDRDAIVEVLAYGRSLSRTTVYRGIEAVPPGCSVQLSPGEPAVVRAPAPVRPHELVDPADLVRALDRALEDSLDRCLQADRPIGLAYSGGLDSSVLAATLARQDRALPSVQVSTDNGPDAVDLTGYLDLLADAVAVMAGPTRMTSVPLYLALARAAADAGIVVLLTGEGADELLLGYESYDALPTGRPLDVDALERFHFPPTRQRIVNELAGAGEADRCAEVYRSRVGAPAAATADPLREAERIMSLEPLLERSDLCLMAAGVEGRAPYLHGGVPALMLGASPWQLRHDGIGKRPLRQLAERLRPGLGAIPKEPFRAPLQRWLRAADDQENSRVGRLVDTAAELADLSGRAARSVVEQAPVDGEAAAMLGALLALGCVGELS